MLILVTGVAGFIGHHLAKHLLARGDCVVGLDNLNAYYDVNLKLRRLERLQDKENFSFHKLDLCDKTGINQLFDEFAFDAVVNLAAQAGVRYSLESPETYIDSNLAGFGNILEACRHHKTKHLVFASSSSVYGANTRQPFSEAHGVDHPVSLYAATKKANEMMAHSYAHLYGLPCTGLRFFTVYGPWGRPDMALFKFTRLMLAGEPIDLYNEGNMIRDFTYVTDVVEATTRIIDQPATPHTDWQTPQGTDPGSSAAPYLIYNIASSNPLPLTHFVAALEDCLGIQAQRNLLPMQPGDVHSTHADTTRLERDFNFKPSTSVTDGIQAFVDWYREYYPLSPS